MVQHFWTFVYDRLQSARGLVAGSYKALWKLTPSPMEAPGSGGGRRGIGESTERRANMMRVQKSNRMLSLPSKQWDLAAKWMCEPIMGQKCSKCQLTTWSATPLYSTLFAAPWVVRHGSVRVRHGSVGSVLGCCEAAPEFESRLGTPVKALYLSLQR
jgi:hypothetical protein